MEVVKIAAEESNSRPPIVAVDREQVFNGIGGLLSTLFLASTIILFSFLQMLSSGEFEQWTESDCRSPLSGQNFVAIVIPALQINIVVIQICCSVLLVQMVFQIGGLTVTYWHRQMVVLISGILYIMFTILLCLMSYAIFLFSLAKFPNSSSVNTCKDVEASSVSSGYWNSTMLSENTYGDKWFWFCVGGILVVFLWASCVVGPAQVRFNGDRI